VAIEAEQQLLHYRLIEKIGEGGMGVVWRAEDTTLQREVAIKILPDTLAGDAERLARFGREARLLATLNHPNIAAVYGLHEAEGVNFLAMELVRGEDLSQRIARGPLPVDEALDIARDVAEALRVAHAGGVIHRDLKPANIRLGPEGKVKVLDFGLAKVLSSEGEASSPSASPALSPTVTSLGTVAGVLLGTAAYMSPEQARGKTVDKRADIWAFGCVLFEMLAGKVVFPGETITDTLAAVIRAEPEWSGLPATLPRRVRKVLELCLAKNPRKRLHDIADAALLMEGELEEDFGQVATAAAAPDSRKSRLREGLAWTLAVGAIVTAIALGWRPDTGEGPGPPTRFTIRLADDAPLSFIDEPILAFGSDGRKIAFTAQDPASGRSIVYLRALDQSEPWPLPGTEGGGSPFFSPDGEHIGFFSEGELRRVSLSGGSPITLAETPNPRGGVWLPDGTILYSPEYSSGLWRVPASGGTPQPVVEPDFEQGERTFRWPTALPDGKTVLFTVGSADSPNNYDQASIAAFSLDDGARTALLEGANMARFVPPDKLVFSRAGTLHAVGFDPAGLELLGEPFRVKDGVGGDPSSGAGYFDVSPAGDLTYVAGAITDAKANLVLIDREGSASPLPLEPRGFHQPRFAPDGSKIAFTVGRGVHGVSGDVWVFSFTDGGLRRVTFGGSDLYPLWQPDGSRIAFLRSSDSTVVSKAADGSGEVELITQSTTNVLLPSSWSPDRRAIALTRTARSTDVYLLNLGDDEPQLFAEDASAPMISPDGRWLAYASPAAGNATIYVEPVEGEGKWQVSPDLGSYPRWSPDGRQLFFIGVGESERPLMEVDVAEGETFRCSMPRVVIDDLTRYVTATAPMINWDTDGDRFAFVELLRDDDTLFRIEVTLDWARQLSLDSSR
jgi:serine/threonine-protein kinase